MASTVVGLFEQRSDAEAALNELVSNRFDKSDIDIKTSDSGLMSELQGEGVPEEDAKMFAEGVRSGDVLEVAHTSDDRAQEAQDIMNRYNALDIHDAYAVRGRNTMPAAGMTAGTTAPPMTGTRTDVNTVNTGGDQVIPIVEEELTVGKRQIQRGGARVHTRVIEKPVSEQVTLRGEQVSVDRRPVDRAATNADMAFKDETIEVTETDEVPVVSKEARVVEEVVIGKTASEHTETVSDTVRRTDVDVENLDTTGAARTDSAARTTGTAGTMAGNGVPGVQTGGHDADGSPDTRGILEKTADAVTGDKTDDKTGKHV